MARSFVACGLLFSALGIVEAKLDAQEIKIRLIDGRNGQPLANTCVNVWVGSSRKEALAIPTDSKGTAKLYLTSEGGKIDISHSWSGCGLFGVLDPVVMYQEDIRINVGYVLCQTSGKNYSWLSTNGYVTKDLVQKGVVSENRCGKATEERKPGELVLFVRPLNWWEKLKQ
jgi:hypothetical protein